MIKVAEYVKSHFIDQDDLLKSMSNGGHLLAVRSSSSQEDLPNQAGAGLYDSILDVKANDSQAIIKAITDVWLSLFTKRAVISRKQLKGAKVPLMAVLIQEQIKSEYSFILHSKDPFSNSEEQVYAEIAVGLGETLASGNQQGTPYRLTSDSKVCEIKSFANYSEAVIPGSTSRVDYSTVKLTLEPDTLIELGMRFGKVAKQIESAYANIP